MADVVVLGGGFGGVVAAETLARKLSDKHRVTLVARRREFVFYPALVRLAFGRCSVADVVSDLPRAMLSRRIEFIEAEVAYPDPEARCVVLSDGRYESRLPYDYLIFALGRRLAVASIEGFFGHAHHLLDVGAALRLRERLKDFARGRAVIGYCEDARLAVPVYEAAFALDRLLRARGERARVQITLVSPSSPGDMLGGDDALPALNAALDAHGIELISNFAVESVTANEVRAGGGARLDYDLLMLVPPFQGPVEAGLGGIADAYDYVCVNRLMQATGAARVYAAGDAVNFGGPKLGHMAVLQGQVAAANIAAEIAGREPQATYDHDLMLVIDAGGDASIFLRKDLWDDSKARVLQGRFWGWAKRVHAKYWQRLRLNHEADEKEI